MQKSYKTVLNEAAAEYEEKKSRFIANVRPVATEEEAVAFIQELKTKYWDARHNVYAYLVSGDTTVQRYSDDGEPSGTAGMPVMEVIRKTGIQDVVIVVTRYFGGTLLGAAGLIRAYGKSASMGIEAAGVVTRILCRQITIMVEYTLFGKVQNFIVNNGIITGEIRYDQDVTIEVFVPVEEVDRFIEDIVELTNDRAMVECGDKVWKGDTPA